ncbi:MAG: FAD-dependent 5-carboxymethylaminomethyl-2-thiouridine(34) oxidoreductase MnmC [Aquabacterium sp.]
MGVPYSPLYDDVYHAAAGAWAQARHVFLGGNGLPGRWQGRSRFVILETGFGLGNNFLATWSAWRHDPGRCDHLVFVSIEKHPLRRDDLSRVHGLAGPGQADAAQTEPDHCELARRLVDVWPVLTPGMHTLHFEDPGVGPRSDGAGFNRPHVTLLLGLGDIADLLPTLVAQVDAFYLDGFAPAKNPDMWDEGLLSRLNRLAAPGATAATWSAARGVRDGLSRAGFEVQRVAGFAGKRDMVRAVYAPRYQAPAPAGGLWPEVACRDDRHAVVIGAGLAGCSAALALCREGWRVTLIDRHEGPAQEASGNPGGLFHSVLHGEDGVHARAHRQAALTTWADARARIDRGELQGDARGLLRLDARMNRQAAESLLDRLGLPTDHVTWLDQDQACEAAGVTVPSGGWLFRQAGWLHPAGLAHSLLRDAAAFRDADGPLLTCRWQTKVDGLRRDEAGAGWQIWCAGELVAQAPSVVLCQAGATPELLAGLDAAHAVFPFPLGHVRGQISVWASDDARCHPPNLPVAGAGYALALDSGTLLCGATTQHNDPDPTVREPDHRHNLAQAHRLGACDAMDALAPLPAGLQGRTAWRATTPDRLPVVGAMPVSLERLQANAGGRADQVRLIPRQRDERGGLFVLAGLGSRGITWSALAGDLLAHWVTGAPCPVEADLRDALDPARFLVRQITKGASGTPRPHTTADQD